MLGIACVNVVAVLGKRVVLPGKGVVVAVAAAVVVVVVSQDTYWCHTVSVFSAFSPNRIGEHDTYCRIYCSANCTTN